MTDLEFIAVHSSGRYDRRLRTVKKATKFYRASNRTSLVSHTEMTAKERAEVFQDVKGWGFNRHRGAGGSSDPVMEWDQSVWDLENEDTIMLSNMRFRRTGGGMSGATWCAKTLLTHNDVRLATWVMHMPQYDIPARREVADDCFRTLIEDVKHEMKLDKHLNVLVRGDMNLNYRNFTEKRILLNKFSPVGLSCNWKGYIPPLGGTFRDQLICMDFHNMKNNKTWLLKDDASSDHRPYGSAYGAFA